MMERGRLVRVSGGLKIFSYFVFNLLGVKIMGFVYAITENRKIKTYDSQGQLFKEVQVADEPPHYSFVEHKISLTYSFGKTYPKNIRIGYWEDNVHVKEIGKTIDRFVFCFPSATKDSYLSTFNESEMLCPPLEHIKNIDSEEEAKELVLKLNSRTDIDTVILALIEYHKK